MGQLHSGLVESVKLGSQLVFDVVQFDFEGFDQSGNRVAARVLGLVPLEVEKILPDSGFLFDSL